MKKKYLIKSKIIFKLYLYYFSLKYKFLNKKSYSQFGEDLIITNFSKIILANMLILAVIIQ